MPSINVRTKGGEGEREVAKILNALVSEVRAELGYPELDTRDEIFQRNQNQSAVGGSDLSNNLGLDIEVKRQETLAINTWWKQTLEAAGRSGGIPILIFRQNRKKWRICMFADIPLNAPGSTCYSSLSSCRAEIDLPTFQSWFKTYYKNQLPKFI